MWQRIARLGVRGRDGQVTLVLFGEFLAHLLEVLRVLQHPLGDLEDCLARFGDRHHALAVAHEDVHAQFFLEAADLFADAGL